MTGTGALVKFGTSGDVVDFVDILFFLENPEHLVLFL